METNEYYIMLKAKLNEIKGKITNVKNDVNTLKEAMKESILIDNEVLNKKVDV